MSNSKERAITYSLLAHIRNTGTLIQGPLDIFKPLVKRALAEMNKIAVFKGKSIIEIKVFCDSLFNLDFPIPVLKRILELISKEINTPEVTHFAIYKDGSFCISEYTFVDLDEEIEKQKNEIERIEEMFNTFCLTSSSRINNNESIFKFIEKNKYSLSKYLSNRIEINGEDYTLEALFINFFRKIPELYDIIKNIYIGSIISGYIDYTPVNYKQDILLLLDTNFIVGLLDLNTPESTHTCNTLIKIAKLQGFKTKVLINTIEETKNLLENKCLNFNKSFLLNKVNTEDVYNACERRKFSKVDLERENDNLESTLVTLGIEIIYDTEKLKNKARFSEEYVQFQKIRSSKRSALHDAMTTLYIKEIRGISAIKEFENVRAWFVNNSSSINSEISRSEGSQPISIKADDLLNILWLSSPKVGLEIKDRDLAEIGLTSIISFTLNKDLPKSKVLKELDDNIFKYSNTDLTDKDLILISKRITTKQLTDIESINTLAEDNQEAFIKRLKEESSKQETIDERNLEILNNVIKEFQTKSKGIKKTVIENKETKNLLEKSEIDNEKLRREVKEKDKLIESQIEAWKNRRILRWKYLSVLYLCISIIFTTFAFGYVINLYGSSLELSINNIQLGTLYVVGSAVWLFINNEFYKRFNNCWYNHSNIENFRKGLKIPERFTLNK
jgi:hypothetical protein